MKNMDPPRFRRKTFITVVTLVLLLMQCQFSYMQHAPEPRGKRLSKLMSVLGRLQDELSDLLPDDDTGGPTYNNTTTDELNTLKQGTMTAGGDLGQVKDSVGRLLKAFQDEKQFLRRGQTNIESVVSSLQTESSTFKETISKNSESLLEVRDQLTHEVKQLKEAAKTNANTCVMLGDELMELRQENKDLNEKFKKLHEEDVRHSEEINGLLKNIGKIGRNMELMVTSLRTEMENMVEKREKCQSGDGLGPHTFPIRPSYPTVVTITFNPPFKETPAIVYGLKTLDSASNVNVRVNADIVELTRFRFIIRIVDWADTVMYGARFSWMACPK